MSVETIIDKLVLLEAAVTGIKKAYDETPESIAQGLYPAVINVIDRGTLEFAATELARSEHRIRVIFLIEPTARQDLERREKLARPFIKRWRDKLASDLTLGGSADHVAFDRPSYRYGVITFGGQEWATLEFFVLATEKESITVA